MDGKQRPGRRPYGVAAGIFVVGGFVFFLIASLGTRNNLRHEQAQLDDFIRTPVPSEEQPVELAKGDRLLMFVEHPDEQNIEDLVDVALFWESGQPVDLFEPFDVQRRRHEGNYSVPYAEFAIEQSGTYLLSSDLIEDPLDPAPVVAIGPWPQDDMSVLVIMVGWGGLILCLIGGPLVALRTFILRRRHPEPSA